MNILLTWLFLCSSTVFSDHYFSHLSDAWYPQKANPLRSKLQSMMHVASKQCPLLLDVGRIKALLVPHGAYDYAGVVAASAYQSIKLNTFHRVIIIAPSHFESFQGVALPSDRFDMYKNALGKIALDVSVLKKLKKKCSLFAVYQKPHDIDHAIEMQIPFIQEYCPQAKIVPLMVGDLDREQRSCVVRALLDVVDDGTLVVATSDLMHYGAAFHYTFENLNIAETIEHIDQDLIRAIASLKSMNFKNSVSSTQASICGEQPIMILIDLLGLYDTKMYAYVTGYDRSSHDKKLIHSVSYVGMVFSSQLSENRVQDSPLSSGTRRKVKQRKKSSAKSKVVA